HSVQPPEQALEAACSDWANAPFREAKLRGNLPIRGRLLRVEQHRQQPPASLIEPIQRRAYLVLLFHAHEHALWQRVDVGYFFCLLVESGLSCACGNAPAHGSPGRALGSGEDPGADTIRVV